MALNGLADVLRSRGHVEQADAAYQEALELFGTLDPRRRSDQGHLHNLGYVALGRGQPEEAARLFLASAERYLSVGTDRRGLSECVMGLASVAARAEKPESRHACSGRPRRRWSTSERRCRRAIRPTTNVVSPSCGRGCLPRTSPRHGPPAGELTLDEALAEARRLPEGRAAPVGAPPDARTLTERERDVASLLARGLRTRQIAEALTITDKTAANHVQHVLEKLGVTSRAEVAARAVEFGLRA